jgi:hypothetical protein
VNEILSDPWSHTDENAPEDIAPMPCSFSEPLHYLSITHDQAILEYYDLFDEHVDQAMRKNTNILELLRSDLAKRAFVPQNWEGIRMIPVRLQVKLTMPEVYKPPPRNVNPKLWEVAREEFDRLSTYFYVKSYSPRVSPLVFGCRLQGRSTWHPLRW